MLDFLKYLAQPPTFEGSRDCQQMCSNLAVTESALHRLMGFSFEHIVELYNNSYWTLYSGDPKTRLDGYQEQSNGVGITTGTIENALVLVLVLDSSVVIPTPF